MWLAAIWEQALKRGNARQPPADLCNLSIQKETYPMLNRASGFFCLWYENDSRKVYMHYALNFIRSHL